ncbi:MULTISPECIES: hypothetical protein [unclassified Pseudofrankia]|uniref:hypothetical protein n=1 Tax=unclassified Pseudofrankia TaxID=2994372 RepID=UPI0008D8DCCC|nr:MULTISPECIES: hypothetical protein [unclassified Pseudofrankia]MDT3445630.1 hypothetical protein [Pseudofrankia sp. BMG5.37]OHV63523.1 hypothetical protein BCD48_38010 [Pseudofrankia sp. BMG5.36]
MRPTPAETIAGVRAVLRDVIEPEVRSDFARARLREIRAVLAQIDWDDAALRVRHRTDLVVGLLADIDEWVGADGDRRDHFADLARRIRSLSDGPLETFAEVNARYTQAAEILAQASHDLGVWWRAHQGSESDDSCPELRLRIVAQLAK